MFKTDLSPCFGYFLKTKKQKKINTSAHSGAGFEIKSFLKFINTSKVFCLQNKIKLLSTNNQNFTINMRKICFSLTWIILGCFISKNYWLKRVVLNKSLNFKSSEECINENLECTEWRIACQAILAVFLWDGNKTFQETELINRNQISDQVHYDWVSIPSRLSPLLGHEKWR